MQARDRTSVAATAGVMRAEGMTWRDVRISTPFGVGFAEARVSPETRRGSAEAAEDDQSIPGLPAIPPSVVQAEQPSLFTPSRGSSTFPSVPWNLPALSRNISRFFLGTNENHSASGIGGASQRARRGVVMQVAVLFTDHEMEEPDPDLVKLAHRVVRIAENVHQPPMCAAAFFQDLGGTGQADASEPSVDSALPQEEKDMRATSPRLGAACLRRQDSLLPLDVEAPFCEAHSSTAAHLCFMPSLRSVRACLRSISSSPCIFSCPELEDVLESAQLEAIVVRRPHFLSPFQHGPVPSLFTPLHP